MYTKNLEFVVQNTLGTTVHGSKFVTNVNESTYLEVGRNCDLLTNTPRVRVTK